MSMAIVPGHLQFRLPLSTDKFVGALAASYEAVTTTFGKLLSPCILGHGEMLRTRDEEGHLALQCSDCGQMTRVLSQPAVRGPKHHAAPVKGAPVLTVKRVAVQSRYPRSA